MDSSDHRFEKFKISNDLRISNPSLSLRELEALARALLPVLLAFLDARVACDEPRLLQGRTQVRVKFHQSARYAVADSSGLARRAASRDVDEDVELVGCLRQLQGLANNHAQRFVGKVLLERLAIDLDFARARSQVDARRRSLAPSRSVILLCFSHSFSCPLKSLIYS